MSWEHIYASMERVIEKAAEAMRENERKREQERKAEAKREKLCAEVLGR